MLVLDDVVFGTVAKPLNDIYYVATRTNKSYYFSNCVLLCAIFGRYPLGYVRIHAISVTHILSNAMATLMR